jgi:threonine synthase
MKYYSTNGKSPKVDFREATIKGQAPDKGLYFPEHIPRVQKELIKEIEGLSNEEIAFSVIKPFVGNSIPGSRLLEIVKETISFPIPLVGVNENSFSLELFHGPTLAFKDIGARFMSRCLGHFLAESDKKITVLVATSGDTGGAVANGFYGVDGVEVIILYPSGKVSPVQEKQLTTPGRNIHALEVAGTFDDCQQMVKQAFADPAVTGQLFLTSANSINVARWLPQQFYYFFAYKQWRDKEHPPVISVPSGNFGNICAGILANKTGLPIRHFIAACNTNDIVARYLSTQKYELRTAFVTLSNAMDVGNPSNFIRILEIFEHRFPDLKDHLTSYSVTDEETVTTIREIYGSFNYLLDPHGAVGYRSLQHYLSGHPGEKGIFLETAHPVKFPDAIEKALGIKVEIPEKLVVTMAKEKQSIRLEPVYEKFRDYLLKDK